MNSKKYLIMDCLRELYRLLVVAIAYVLLDPVQVVCDLKFKAVFCCCLTDLNIRDARDAYISIHRWETFGTAFLLTKTDDACENPLEFFIVVVPNN